MANKDVPTTVADPLLSRAINDWQTVAHGGSSEAFLQDMKDLYKRDTTAGQTPGKTVQDLTRLNEELQKKGLLPNMMIFGEVDNHIVIGDMSRPGKYGVLDNRNGKTQIEDADVDFARGTVREKSDTPRPLDDAPDQVKASGVNQGGEITDCRFEARLASLAQEDPASISKMIKDNKDGSYTVTFPGDPKHPQTVLTPTPWERTTFGNGSAEWAQIIGKAYRQRENLPFGPGNDSAKDIEGLLTGRKSTFLANASEACGTLTIAADWLATKMGANAVCRENETGNVSQFVDSGAPARAIDKRDMGKWLQQALDDHMIVTTGFNNQELRTSPPYDVAKDAAGNVVRLEGNHAYTVIGFDPVKKVVTLRNPWGENIGASGNDVKDGGLVEVPLDQFSRLTLGLDVEKTAKSR